MFRLKLRISGRFYLALCFLWSCQAKDPFVLTPSSPCEEWVGCPEGVLLPNNQLITEDLCVDENKEWRLPELVDLGLRNSRQTRTAWAETRMRAAEYGMSLSDFYPDISFSAYVEALRESDYLGSNRLSKLPGIGPVVIDEFREWAPTLSLSYLIFDWGTRSAESERFRYRLLNANWSFNREIQDVIQQITQDYYNYLGYEGQLEAAKANVNDAQTFYNSTHKKFSLGIVDKSSDAAALTQLSKQQVELLHVAQQLDTSYTQLIADLGIPSTTHLRLFNRFDLNEAAIYLECTVQECIREAFTCRPDLFASYSIVQAAESGVQAAKRDRLPKVNLEAGGQRSYFDGSHNEGTDYSAQVSLDFPIFKGFWYENRIRLASCHLCKVQAEFEQLQINVIQEVVNAHRNLELAKENLVVNEVYVNAAQVSYSSMLAQYEAGVVDITSVVNAFNYLAEARYSFVEAQKGWFSSVLELAYATGNLGTCKRMK